MEIVKIKEYRKPGMDNTIYYNVEEIVEFILSKVDKKNNECDIYFTPSLDALFLKIIYNILDKKEILILEHRPLIVEELKNGNFVRKDDVEQIVGSVDLIVNKINKSLTDNYKPDTDLNLLNYERKYVNCMNFYKIPIYKSKVLESNEFYQSVLEDRIKEKNELTNPIFNKEPDYRVIDFKLVDKWKTKKINAILVPECYSPTKPKLVKKGVFKLELKGKLAEMGWGEDIDVYLYYKNKHGEITDFNLLKFDGVGDLRIDADDDAMINEMFRGDEIFLHNVSKYRGEILDDIKYYINLKEKRDE